MEILNACRGLDPAFAELEANCRILNPYSVTVRHPGYPGEYTEEDALDALVRARRMRSFVRERLRLDKSGL
jgi:hypothetical protein